MYNRYCTNCNKATMNRPYNNKTFCGKCKTKFLLECLKCNSRFEHYKHISYHIKYLCEPEKHVQECPKCGKKFKNHGTLKKHTIYCGQNPNLHCEFCPYKTKYRSGIINHLRTHNNTMKTNNSLIDEGQVEGEYICTFEIS